KKLVFGEIALRGFRNKEGLGGEEFRDQIPIQFVIDEAMMTPNTGAKIISCYSLTNACPASTLPPLASPPPCALNTIPGVTIVNPASNPHTPVGNAPMNISIVD